MAKTNPETRVLVLCADNELRDSLADLLCGDGRTVLSQPASAGAGSPNLVVTVCDSWPSGWSHARLRTSFQRVPCLMLSGSPLAGDFAAAQLPRGYFLRLPALPEAILGLVAEMSAA